MRSILLMMAFLSTLAALGSAAVNAQPIAASAPTLPGNAPIGHLQPRAQQFVPSAPAEQAVQDNMRLNICRGC